MAKKPYRCPYCGVEDWMIAADGWPCVDCFEAPPLPAALPLFPGPCDHEDTGGAFMEGKPVLAPSFWRDLADNNPIGIDLSADDAKAWFDLVWLSYSTHHYTKHRRAIINWWSRVTEEEIERARARAYRIVDDADTARLEEMAQADLQESAGVTRGDHFAKMRA